MCLASLADIAKFIGVSTPWRITPVKIADTLRDNSLAVAQATQTNTLFPIKEVN